MIFTCTTFTGHWPVGVAAIVEADTPENAADMLNAEIRKGGLPGDAKPEDMKPFDGGAVVLCDGNY